MIGMSVWKDEEPIGVACTMLTIKLKSIVWEHRPIWYWNKNEPGKKSQKPSLEVDFRLSTSQSFFSAITMPKK